MAIKNFKMKPGWQFIFAILVYILTGKLRSKNRHLPFPGHQVPADFIGVCVATSEDPVMDAYVIARLRELGICQIRLDFTYGDENNHKARFLDRLSKESFHIMLHLLQPYHAAKEMETSEAQEVWRNFVADVLDRFGDKIELVEIGSTVNRRSLAGYTLKGFLNAWRIAHAEVRRCKIRLAGPNLTDFEPLFNIGLLSILKSCKQLPDVHTNNLFSERCTEPERNDHKIIGHRLASLCRYKLIKKAFLLQQIGKDFGVPELLSPVAFWTLPRIHRLLPDGEKKQADYLARYMLLCAASGVLRRASWGPLISHREGLIDDGVGQAPALDCVVYYAGVSGDVSMFRLRPAFHAMKTFTALFSGMHYEGRLNRTALLEVHAFSSEKCRIHAVWTTNGRATALKDIYTAEDICAAEYISRDGDILDAAPELELITESPVYLRFPAARIVVINSAADVIYRLSIHRHIRKKHILFRQDDWQGVLVVRDEEEHAHLSSIHPSQISAPSPDVLLRHSRNAVWTVPDPRDPASRLVIKKPVKMHWYKKLLGRFKPSKGLRSWNGAAELLRRGIETAPPIAYFEKDGDARVMQNYYICEHVNADFSARQLCSAFAAGKKMYQGVSEEDAYRQLCEFLFTMHSCGVFFRDLSGGNILIKKSEDDTLVFSLIDTGRAHFFDYTTPLSKSISDLVRVCNKMNAAGRNRFMELYLAKRGKSFGFRYRLPFYLYNTKVVIKRRFRRKNLIKLLKF